MQAGPGIGHWQANGTLTSVFSPYAKPLVGRRHDFTLSGHVSTWAAILLLSGDFRASLPRQALLELHGVPCLSLRGLKKKKGVAKHEIEEKIAQMSRGFQSRFTEGVACISQPCFGERRPSTESLKTCCSVNLVFWGEDSPVNLSSY